MFWLLAGLMSLLALAFVLPPLWRAHGSDAPNAADRRRLQALEHAHAAGVLDDREYAEKRAALALDEPAPAEGARPWIAAAVLALTIPLGAWVIYGQVGEPGGLDPEARTAGIAGTDPHASVDGASMDMERAIASLAERLRGEPDNLDGWLLLGRAYKSMERFEPALEALEQAYRLAPDEPDVIVEYAEVSALASPDRLFDPSSRALLQQAVTAQPDHQRGIWLLGIAAMQAGEYEQAIAHWEHLQGLLGDDAEAIQSLQMQIDNARERSGAGPAVSAPAPPGMGDGAAAALQPPMAPAAVYGNAEAGAARLTIRVDIDPALRGRVGNGDILFVYARAVEGSRVPIAIRQMPATELPVTVVLDDSTSMMPQLKLSALPEVVVGARISRSGLATPERGDLETYTDPVAVSRQQPLLLTIDRIIE
jgi:cytochrome c-type biogenesis protein CcmH